MLGRSVDTPGINPAAAGYLGYIPGGGIYYAALGDFLADVTNRYAGVAYASPGAVEMETSLLDWMASVVGYPTSAVGNLTTGGSMANLIAVVTARQAHELRARDVTRTVVYLSEHVHHCVIKALRIVGLGECIQRHIPVDERYRMIPDALDRAVVADRQAGLIPWMVVASAGTTNTGAIDPLEAIADVAADRGLWFHIDAAYGGFFALCPEVAPRLRGMERSDSIVLDPHKGLFLPFGSGAVLVKNREAMIRAHAYEASYVADVVRDEHRVLSPADVSPEFSRGFRGPRLWLPLLLHGVAPFRACLEEKLLLTRYFYQQVQKIGFEVGPEPELSVATYRHVPAAGDANRFNEALIAAVHRDGRVFISSTTIDGQLVLRLAALAFRTHLDTIDLLLEVLEQGVKQLRGA